MAISASDLKRSVRLTGISLPGGLGITWDYKADERDAAASLLTFFEGRRVLYFPFPEELECPGRVVMSVLELRRRIQAGMESLDRSTYLHGLLGYMRKAVLDFLDYATAKCEEDVSCDDCRVRRIGCIDGIGAMRKTMGNALAALCITFGLDVEEQLASIMPLTGGDDSPINTRVGRKLDEIRRMFEMRTSSPLKK